MWIFKILSFFVLVFTPRIQGWGVFEANLGIGNTVTYDDPSECAKKPNCGRRSLNPTSSVNHPSLSVDTIVDPVCEKPCTFIYDPVCAGNLHSQVEEFSNPCMLLNAMNCGTASIDLTICRFGPCGKHDEDSRVFHCWELIPWG